MIKKLKIKFIALSMISIFVLLTVVIAGMNLMNFNSVIKEADEILQILSQNRGMFPELEKGNENGLKNEPRPPKRLSNETPYESRFFSVVFDKSGNVILTDVSRISTVNEMTAENTAKNLFLSGRQSGFADEFRFICTTEPNGTRLIFLDCSKSLRNYKSFFTASLIMTVAGLLVAGVVITILSGRIIRPIAESYEKQKRFVTDAGHEIKTPLTIISANADLLEADIGENECITDIKQQTSRLAKLTNDLVYLSRIEETDKTLTMIDFPISDIILETSDTFKGLARAQNKEYTYCVQPDLSMTGDSEAVRQLVGILLENALKYSPENGSIALDFSKSGKHLKLTVFNTTRQTVESENLIKMFDRFYRADKSRNSQTGGYGIGLSIAKAIVSAHGGKINATTKSGNELTITVLFNA